MKNVTSLHHSMFLHAPLPLTATWSESRQPSRRPQPRVLSVPASLSTDDLAASKPEIVCGGILAMCFFYTLFHCLVQVVS